MSLIFCVFLILAAPLLFGLFLLAQDIVYAMRGDESVVGDFVARHGRRHLLLHIVRITVGKEKA